MINIAIKWGDREKARAWIVENSPTVACAWPIPIITFYCELEASLFMLAIGGRRIQTTLERLIEIENEKNFD